MALEGLARALNIGLDRAQMLQQQAIERRLREAQMQPPPPVDIAQYLPQDIRERAYPGQESVLVPQNVAPTLASGLFSYYGRQQEAPRQEPMMSLEMLSDWNQAVRTGDYSAFHQKWPGAQIPTQALPSFSLAPTRLAGAEETYQSLGIDQQPIGEEIAGIIAQQLGIEINPQTTVGMLRQTFGDNWVSQFIDLSQAPVETRQREAQMGLTEAQTRARELETQLLEEFGRPERQARLTQAQLDAIRTQQQIELGEEELSRYSQMTAPLVARAVAEAASAETDLALSQETFDATVERVYQELENLRTQGQLSEQELAVAREMAPLQIQEAQERLTDLRLDNERQRLENQFAVYSFNDRLAQIQRNAELTLYEIERAQVDVEQAKQRLAMARRLGPVEEQQAEVELQTARERLRSLELQNRQIEEQRQSLSGMDPNDRNFAFKMYESEIAPFKGQGMWIPSFLDYVSNLMSDHPMDWNQYVLQYNAEMTQRLGPAPQDQDSLELPWLSLEWQRAYRNAADAYYAQFPQYTTRSAPEFPPIEVWYSNQTSDTPMGQDELVEWWNTRNQPELIPPPETNQRMGIVDRIRSLFGRGSSQAAERAVQAFGSAEAALAELENATPEQRAQVESLYGTTIDQLLADLRRMSDG